MGSQQQQQLHLVEPVTVWASESFPDPFEQARMWRQSKHELSHLVGQ